MNMESNNISQAMFTLYRIGFCSVSKVAPVQCEHSLSLEEKGPIIWQSYFTLVLLQVVFYVKARLCRS